MHMHDAVVVGGGPGGLYLARILAERGFDVILLEEHENPGEPVHCTGVLAADAYDEFDIPRDAVLNGLRTARLYSPSGLSFTYTPEVTQAVVVDRRLFDLSLWRRAEDAGVTLIRGVKATAIEIGSSSAVVRLRGQPELKARSCVLACGAAYKLQRSLGLGMPGVFLQSAQLELPAARLGDVELHFGTKVAAKGFAWTVPVRRGDQKYVRVGLMCERDASTHFDRFLKHIAFPWGIDTKLKVAPRRKILPLSPIKKTYSDRLLVIGDAAGLVKPTTGGGIYYSIVSAKCAADVLTKALATDRLTDSHLRAYERRWQQRLGLEIRSQLALRMLTQRLADSEIDELFDLALNDGLIPLIRKTARFNQYGNLIYGLLKHSRVRRILLRRLLG